MFDFHSREVNCISVDLAMFSNITGDTPKALVIRLKHPHIILHTLYIYICNAYIYIYIYMRIPSYTYTCTHPHIHTCIPAHYYYCIDACMHAYSPMYVHMRFHGPQPEGLDVAMGKNGPLIDELPIVTSEHCDFIR